MPLESPILSPHLDNVQKGRRVAASLSDILIHVTSAHGGSIQPVEEKRKSSHSVSILLTSRSCICDRKALLGWGGWGALPSSNFSPIESLMHIYIFLETLIIKL